MCYSQRKDTHKKDTEQTDSVYHPPWDDVSRHNMVFEERYAPKEKETTKKVMVPFSSIIKFIRRFWK